MEYFIFTLVQYMVVLLPIYVYFIYGFIKEKPKSMRSLANLMLSFVLAFYVAMVLEVTGSGTAADIVRGFRFYRDSFNFIPFMDILSYPRGYVLNVVMFVPLGFLSPVIWKSVRNVKSIALLSGTFSLLVELSQICNYRTTDIDDLITNTLGGIIGYVLFRLIHIFTEKADFSHNSSFSCQPFVAVGMMILTKFIVYDEIGLYQAIYL